MDWLNYYGLIIMISLMIPNIIMAVHHKEDFENHFDCMALEILEQVGRCGSFVFMVITLPLKKSPWPFDSLEIIYLTVNGILIIAYELSWLILGKKDTLAKAVCLSVIPSVLFVFSGIVLFNIPLILFSLIFAASHVTVSIKNARNQNEAKNQG